MEKALLDLLQEEKIILSNIFSAKEQSNYYGQMAEEYQKSIASLCSSDEDQIRKEERLLMVKEYLGLSVEWERKSEKFESDLSDVRKELKQYFSFLDNAF